MPQQISLFEQRQNWNFSTILPARKLPWGGGLLARLGGKIQLSHSYENIISLENLCLAWEEFIVGKKKKADVIEFSRNLMDHIVELHEQLVNGTYCHGGYKSFYINDPKRRHVHKASVRDRLLHHAVYRILYPFFDRVFFADSFSCRNGKGIHKAMDRFRAMGSGASKNRTRTVWVLKCDIQKFFASIDHGLLLSILREYIPDENICWLLGKIVESFQTTHLQSRPRDIGLPLGNITSQLFANVYMNKFDQWVKHTLKAKYYIRYADDFVLLSSDKSCLENAIPRIQTFLRNILCLTLHPNKIFLQTFASGVDFLGWVHFPDHRVLRKTTRRRMLARVRISPTPETRESYLGLLGHGNAYKVREVMMGMYWVWS